jgi:hypothetical protein
LIISLGGSLKLVIMRREKKFKYLSMARVERTNNPTKQENMEIFLQSVNDAIYSFEKTYVSSV